MNTETDQEASDPAEALRRLAETGEEYLTVFEHGSLSVGLYRPAGTDRQKPHKRDEIYVVISGHGKFVVNEGHRTFGPGEVLFAAAGAEHRFEDFDDDFATWVFFYGPEGGEEP